MATLETSLNAEDTVRELQGYIDRAVEANGGSTAARKPAHRIKFHWPPHPVSYSFHVLASDWTGTASFEAHGDVFEVQVARTPFGVFGRAPDIWHEERGETEAQMLARLRETSEPLFQRQLAIGRALERPGRFTGHVRDLPPIDLLKLLYCEDRDVANEARSEVETHASSNRVFFPALVAVLSDRRHPNRRSAQWCVLDLFEDLPSYCDSPEEELAAVQAMKGLIWDAENDYARTVYKAGVVLGGHLPYVYGGPTLMECLEAPSRIGRRSAIHGLYHVVEWVPALQADVVAALRRVAEQDTEPILRAYAAAMAGDLERADGDHAADPIFPDEA
ncbi:hypothetical protein [Fimbriimonas ginsengisoli]|uniref:Uncharacterized protein n=1 Tax=Fimbriimonas ginsengisoli Gsoil 348 TaxID=661478 RepID=A0A068NY40_FIMGI|nr:hypothetical protein [Fimbriimonas ginsengisoli]AIE87820.1 hypothetical protein OP10G_4452 [Fimbriimonas ginsengisoli Gsoil 348]